MGGHAVCLDILVHLTEQVWHFGSPPRTGGSGFRVHNQGVHINQPLFDQRIRGQDGTGVIAARICHQPGALRNLVPIHLAETIHCFRNELGGFMFYAVPFFVYCHILDAVVCGKVYDFYL